MKLMKTLFLVIALLTGMLLSMCGSTQQSQQPAKGTIATLTVDEFAKVVKQKKVRLVDVRTPSEYAEEHLVGAENIDVKAADFAEKIKPLKGKVAVYCRSGKRSLVAANQLAAQGCTVYNLDGGIVAWKKAELPTTK